ncbi:MutS protein 1 [Coniosporium tulheliwenetii]|uniref:MutS protein 1 n=1 Tax=Coniosporium tulheliwenetii TaxID=3383036 RepID=A0ACC2ZLF0_9PEZI|nr:MutS protein 1 [Cladosporium sp. JES 115]
MRKFENCVLLTRVGSFYELYFDNAEEYGPLLNLKVSKKKTNKGPVSMAGFPFFQLDRFLKILVQDLNKYVAISEEFANDAVKKVKSGGLLFDRKVTRIITPGTLIDENFMDPWENNYVLSIHVEDAVSGDKRNHEEQMTESSAESLAETGPTELGLAWLDLSSGDFFTQATNLPSLSSAIARIGPREIVVDSSLESIEHSPLMSLLKQDHHILTYHKTAGHTTSIESWTPMLEDPVSRNYASAFTPGEVTAGSFLLDYIRTRLQGSTTKLQPPVRYQNNEYMAVDKNTLRGLEVRATLRDGNYQGSLLHAIRKTVTKSGTRLLTQRLTTPSMSLSVINDRLDLVSELLGHTALRQDVVVLLRRTYDTLRLVQKFAFGKGDADDLLGLASTVQVTQDLATLLKNHLESPRREVNPEGDVSLRATQSTCIHDILKRLNFEGPVELSHRISEAIDEEGLSEQHRIQESEAAAMAGIASEVLQDEADNEEIANVPKRLRPKDTGVPNGNKSDTEFREVWIMKRRSCKLDITMDPGLSYHCHVKGKDVKLTDLGPSARSVSSSRSTKSFHLPEWTSLGARLDNVKMRIRAEEQRVFGELRTQVVRNLVKLRRNAAVLDELDVACSFATLAHEKSLVRPLLNSGTSHMIVRGRHPVVETSLIEQGRTFTANDCFVGEGERILLLTGPNMAGKSTYLRQNALISILAQTGSFVPAEYAEIGLVDKIFSRVGFADNLYQDQSTFMVEMLETAEILKQATPRSFVIMDEVGRGTTPEDGIAVGYACLHHLYHVNRCRTLFATHFHALADLTKWFEKLGCYCTDVSEEAGLPEEAIAVAGRMLAEFEHTKGPAGENLTRYADSATSAGAAVA